MGIDLCRVCSFPTRKGYIGGKKERKKGKWLRISHCNNKTFEEIAITIIKIKIIVTVIMIEK